MPLAEFLRFDLPHEEYLALTPAQRREWDRWLLNLWSDLPATAPKDALAERDTGWTEPTK